MNSKYLIALLMIVLFLSGCTKENMDDCDSGLRLDFKFVLHTDGQGNRFDADIKVVRVYIFDENDVLCHVQQESGAILTNDYIMNVNITPGKYTVIAWGGGSEDLMGSYHEGTMTDRTSNPPVYNTGVRIGETTLDQFSLLINYSPAPELPEDVVPALNEIDDLYYGAVGTRNAQTSVYTFEKVEVKSGVITQRNIDMIRNTNILKIIVSGIENLGPISATSNSASRTPSVISTNGFKLWTVASNGRYQYDNIIDEHARTIRYTPHYAKLDGGTIVAEIKTLRFDMDRRASAPLYLYIESPDGRRFPNRPLDVITTLLQAKNPQTGNYIYENQSDFDRIYEHPIELRIGGDLSVRIFIGEWEVIYVTPA